MKTTWLNTLTGTLVLLGMASAPLQAQPTAAASNLAHPESVASDGKFLYVTNLGAQADALAADGDGSVARLALDGRLLARNLAAVPLHSPKGTALVGHVLYVADLHRLIGLDPNTGQQVYLLDFSSAGVKMLNDLAVKDDSTLFATATDTGQVFEVALGRRPRFAALAVPAIAGANGLCYDRARQRLYVAGSGSFAAARGEGRVGYIDWAAGQPRYHTLGAATGFFDGVALLGPDHLLVSDWVNLAQPQGVLRQVNVATGETTVLGEKTFGGPADFLVTENRQALLVPAMQTGELLRVPLPPRPKPAASGKAQTFKTKQ